MKVKYDQDADVIIFFLRDDPPVDAIEEAGGVIVSYGKDGEPVTVEFMNASLHNLVTANELSITLLQTKNIAIA
ncbi:MAG: DUF2283 domain-containing protein [Candidatus Acididesulfobacter diazotrophicus]|uniref:DUF2283 domain-containing protein n=1 Tax=Candidatus Acididesulfobacter diazotrophicus TaxID=2597226 RepID=A0A519BMZ7_9DELT|nr:MAG: DUF2283 domain-containing protein [Candidatus Acididesulfobacter diazotrophicus]